MLSDAQDTFHMSEFSLLLKFESPVDSIDHILDHPLISFPALGSLLLAEDTGINDFYQTPVSLMSSVEYGHALQSLRPPMQIDDELVVRMKTTIELPLDENYPATPSGLGRRSSPTFFPRHHHTPSLLSLGGGRQERYTILGDGTNYYLGPAMEPSSTQSSPRSLNFVLPKLQPQQVYIPSLPPSPLSPSHRTYHR